jgi:hypothetical protein
MHYDELQERINNDSDLSGLPGLTSILYLIQKTEEKCTKEDFLKLSGLIKQSPQNKLYRLLWIIYLVQLLKKGEQDYTQINTFLKIVFEQYNDLVEINNFVEATGILDLISPQTTDKELQNTLIPILQRALETRPEKIILQSYLGMIYFYMEDYKRAMHHLDEVRLFVNTNWSGLDKINFDAFRFHEYLSILQYLALSHEQLGDSTNAERYANYILSNLPVFHSLEDKKKEEDISFFIAAFFLRMRSDMKKNNSVKVLKNYNRVEEYLGTEDWEAEFSDVIKYVKNIKHYN